MFVRLVQRLKDDQSGITGLETAIILIAFVVVAAVFAYTVLSAGIFSTQKSQEAVYSGLQEARSSLVLRGGVIATANNTGSDGTIKQLSFIVSGVLGGEALDFTPPDAASDNSGVAGNHHKVVISYVDKSQQVHDLYWTLTKLGNADADNVLEQNEQFQVTIGSSTVSSDGGNLIDALGTPLTTNTTFSLLVLTPAGPVLEVERTTPAYIDTKINLH